MSGGPYVLFWRSPMSAARTPKLCAAKSSNSCRSFASEITRSLTNRITKSWPCSCVNAAVMVIRVPLLFVVGSIRGSCGLCAQRQGHQCGTDDVRQPQLAEFAIEELVAAGDEAG